MSKWGLVPKPVLRFAKANFDTILERLHFEERLLHRGPGNVCLLGWGPATPAAVLGTSGKVNLDVNEEYCRSRGVQIVRRYSGGGTVLVNRGTLVLSLICDSRTLGDEFKPWPREIMQWTHELYEPVFGRGFQLQNHDYALGDRKFGGNAQKVSGHWFVHHTVMLWEADFQEMGRALKLPPKRPDWRRDRTHEEFLCTLSPHFANDPRAFEARLQEALSQVFDVERNVASSLLPTQSEPEGRFRLRSEEVVVQLEPT